MFRKLKVKRKILRFLIVNVNIVIIIPYFLSNKHGKWCRQKLSLTNWRETIFFKFMQQKFQSPTIFRFNYITSYIRKIHLSNETELSLLELHKRLSMWITSTRGLSVLEMKHRARHSLRIEILLHSTYVIVRILHSSN